MCPEILHVFCHFFGGKMTSQLPHFEVKMVPKIKENRSPVTKEHQGSTRTSILELQDSVLVPQDSISGAPGLHFDIKIDIC